MKDEWPKLALYDESMLGLYKKSPKANIEFRQYAFGTKDHQLLALVKPAKLRMFCQIIGLACPKDLL